MSAKSLADYQTTYFCHFVLIGVLDMPVAAAPNPACFSTLQSQCFFLGIVAIIKLLKSKPPFQQSIIILCC